MAVSKMGRRYTPTPNFKPGGSKGKLHRALGIPEGEKIPAGRLKAATRSAKPEVRRMAIRAETMIHKFKHTGRKGRAHHNHGGFAYHPPHGA